MKKILSVLTTIIVLFNIIKPNNVQAISFHPAKKIYSEMSILYNLDTQTVVYEKNADIKKPPAQLVQIMTAIVAMESISNLEDTYECPELINDVFDAYRAKYPEETFPYNEITTCFISPGEQLSAKNLIYAMLLRSSCEAALTLAYNIGGNNIDSFVNKMNEKAVEIGAVNTHFTNPTGLHDDNQYSTARDMMLISEYAINLRGFSEIASQYSYQIPATNLDPDGILLQNVNPMMESENEKYYPGTKGIKTGNSHQSGRCLVARASKDGSNYLVVLLNAPLESDNEPRFYHIEDATILFDWAFENIKHMVVLESSQEVRTLKVNYAKGKDSINLKPANDISCMWDTTVPTDAIDMTDIEYVYDELNAPIKAGEKLGTLTIKYSGNEIGKVDLVAYGDVERSFVKYSMAIVESYFNSGSFSQAIKIATGLSIIYIVIVIYTINKRAKTRREKRMAQSRAAKK